MAKNKTFETTKSITSFIDAVPDETKRDDSYQLIELMKGLTGFDPKMWGPSIIGFGSCHYRYESGHEGDMPVASFSPRSTGLVIYGMGSEKNSDLQKKLGKHKASKGCLYIRKLEDVDAHVLKKMISNSIKDLKSRYTDNKKKKSNT
jgi:Domain of unknown function (DU1801)